ncbi:MAG: SpoIIE family protein phosphatase [Cytophagales bacterium]|nr:SpoIIE family protein phosphatase [Cytophagales bacterium]
MKQYILILLLSNFLVILSGFNLHPVRYLFLKAKWVNSFSHYYYIIVLLILILSNGVKLKAQTYNFRTYSIEHGLAQSQVFSICEDKRGNIWFGTGGGGVSVYDGASFRHFTKKEGLGNDHIQVIVEDRAGNLWFGSLGGGVTKYDGLTFTHFTQNDDCPHDQNECIKGLVNDIIWAIFEDRHGYLWFGTHNGITRYDPKRKKGLKIRNYTARDGLSNNTVISIVEDNESNMWFGTYGGGVFKFVRDPSLRQGQLFENYTIKEGLCSNYILSMLKDRSGILWFGSDGRGVSLLQIENNNKSDVNLFTNFEIGKGLNNNIVRSIIQDRDGNIWFGTSGGGVSKLLKTQIIQIKNTKIETRATKLIHYTENQGLSNNMVNSILEDTAGNLWIGTSGGGVCKLSREIFKHYTENDGLKNNIVWSILEDRRGNLWFGTDGGGASQLKIVPNTRERLKIVEQREIPMITGANSNVDLFTNFTKNNGLTGNIVRTILEDHNGYIWFGTEGGLTRFNPLQKPISSKSFYYITEKEGLIDNSVYTMIEDRRGKLWFGMFGGGVARYDPDISVNNSGAFTYFTERDGLASNRVVSMLEDHSGNIWIGTSGWGITMLSFRDTFRLMPEFIHITKKGSCPITNKHDCVVGLSSNSVSCIVEDSVGNMWFGTEGGGINKLVLSKKQGTPPSFIHITTENGLSSNNIYLMVFDNTGNLWAGTEKGLDKIVPEYSGEIRHYGKAEGFVGIETNSRAVYKDSKGFIWFGTINGVTQYNPGADIPNTIEPQTHITGIKLFFEEIGWQIKSQSPGLPEPRVPGGTGGIYPKYPISRSEDGLGYKRDNILHPSLAETKYASSLLDEINYDGVSKWYPLPINLALPYDRNHISFSFIGISLNITEKVRYKFKLEGLDAKWSPVTSKREAVYPNIPPGEYTFKVKASNNDGMWNEQAATFSFIITPPFWQTWWFYMFCGITTLSGIFGFIKIRVRNLQAAKKMLEQEVIMRTVEIVKQKEEIEKQKNLLEEKNRNIIDSINYAKLIQEAIFPSVSYMKHLLPESFIYYKPRDIVSGDFYWITETVASSVIIAAVDCTGHGVPGAFMSIIGQDQLNQTVKEKWIIVPSEILDEMNKGVRDQLGGVLPPTQSELKDSSVKDGMDMALCSIDLHKRELQFAGAYNSLYMIRNNTLKVINGDRFPIGIFPGKSSKKFTNHEIKLQKGDTLYIFSDGYADQFGGPKGKKFMRKRFMQIFLDIQHLSMEDQQKSIDKTFEQWKGNEEQVDDILVIGIRM